MGTYQVTFLRNRQPIRQIDVTLQEAMYNMEIWRDLIEGGHYTNIQVVRFDKDGKIDEDFWISPEFDVTLKEKK